jgi:hypothetical protein
MNPPGISYKVLAEGGYFVENPTVTIMRGRNATSFKVLHQMIWKYVCSRSHIFQMCTQTLNLSLVFMFIIANKNSLLTTVTNITALAQKEIRNFPNNIFPSSWVFSPPTTQSKTI